MWEVYDKEDAPVGSDLSVHGQPFAYQTGPSSMHTGPLAVRCWVCLITAVSAHARMPDSHHKHGIQKMVDMFVATRQACNGYPFKLSLRLKVVFSGMWLNSSTSFQIRSNKQLSMYSFVLESSRCG
jgi:hypothetical protein